MRAANTRWTNYNDDKVVLRMNSVKEREDGCLFDHRRAFLFRRPCHSKQIDRIFFVIQKCISPISHGIEGWGRE
jgi:hypothetical protein